MSSPHFLHGTPAAAGTQTKGTFNAGEFADRLIQTECQLQDKMWGTTNDRAPIANGQLRNAGMAQLDLLWAKGRGFVHDASFVPSIYPEDWSGFRDYGSDIANLVVAAAFIRQEIKRKLANGEDYTRAKRPESKPYTAAQPRVSSEDVLETRHEKPSPHSPDGVITLQEHDEPHPDRAVGIE